MITRSRPEIGLVAALEKLDFISSALRTTRVYLKVITHRILAGGSAAAAGCQRLYVGKLLARAHASACRYIKLYTF